MELVNRETAQADIQRWIEAKRIKGSILEAKKPQIEMLIQAVQDGDLIVNEDCTLTQNLLFEPGGETKLTYKTRITQIDIDKAKEHVKGNDFDTLILRTQYALTGAMVNVLRNLDLSTDRVLADTIAVFFM